MKLTEKQLKSIIHEEIESVLTEEKRISNYFTTTVGVDMSETDKSAEAYEAGMAFGYGMVEADRRGVEILKNWTREDNTNYWDEFANGVVDGLKSRSW